jgi:subfamily B ATP-binding cassette protein MsbA
LSSAGALVRGLGEPVAAMLVIVLLIVQTSILQRPIAAVLVMMLLFHRIMQKLMAAQHAWNNFCALVGSVDMFAGTMAAAEAQREPQGTGAPVFERAIELRHVNVNIGSAQILKDVSLTVPVGATIGLTGESGAGKSTLVDVITGLLKPASGEVLVDGVSLQDLDLEKWRRQIGYVVQENVVFQDSIANNIGLWRTGDAEGSAGIEGAVKSAQLHDVVGESADGLSTAVGDRGISLSVGQRQRLALARELFKQPRVLILDEATSALDSRTEEEIQRRTTELRGHLTLIIIAHRLSTIRNCDHVYVLSKGRIVESGTYDELIGTTDSRLSLLANGQRSGAATSRAI